MNEFKLGMSNFANFSGRTTRREYWMFILFLIIFYLVFAFVFGLIVGLLGIGSGFIELFINLIGLVFFLPSISACVRRLHDVNKSGWFVLLSIVPIVSFYILYLNCQESHSATNKWGSPRSSNSANSF